MYTGDKVIVRSNENEPYKIGTFLGFDTVGKREQLFPVVQVEGINYICFGIVKQWTQNLQDQLDQLTPREQWNLLSNNIKY